MVFEGLQGSYDLFDDLSLLILHPLPLCLSGLQYLQQFSLILRVWFCLPNMILLLLPKDLPYMLLNFINSSACLKLLIDYLVDSGITNFKSFKIRINLALKPLIAGPKVIRLCSLAFTNSRHTLRPHRTDQSFIPGEPLQIGYQCQHLFIP